MSEGWKRPELYNLCSMSKNRIASVFVEFVFLTFAVSSGCSADRKYVPTNTDRTALQKTSEAIRDAFSRGDVAAIMSYHHPEVVKSIRYGTYLVGRDAVQKDVAGTLQRFHLEWKENRVHSMLIEGDTAVELTDFVIEGTPKNQGDPFVFRGRAMIVYVRYRDSPTGWASIREIIQPAI
jgi:ketosteroid isomerase-like protein